MLSTRESSIGIVLRGNCCCWGCCNGIVFIATCTVVKTDSADYSGRQANLVGQKEVSLAQLLYFLLHGAYLVPPVGEILR
jgi:hypothetical protein